MCLGMLWKGSIRLIGLMRLFWIRMEDLYRISGLGMLRYLVSHLSVARTIAPGLS